MREFPQVFTPEEVAERLRSTPAAVIAELEAGRLRGIQLGGAWRVTEVQLLEFMGIAGEARRGDRGHRPMDPARHRHHRGFERFQFVWQPAEAFTYRWPTRADEPEWVEEYTEAYEGTDARRGPRWHGRPGRHKLLRVAFTTRNAAGMENRRRAIVFLAREDTKTLYPLVEFAGANDYEQTRRMASVIKLPNRKQLRPGDPLPPEYQGFRVAPYSDVVSGPYASNGLAVVVQDSDHNAMAHHALIRARWSRMGGGHRWPWDTYDDGSL